MLFPRRGVPTVLADGALAENINNAGMIVGRSVTNQPIAWTRNGAIHTIDLPVASALDVNARGWVTGVDQGSGFDRAFFWDPSSGAFAHLAWQESVATDINDRGEVTGAIEAGRHLAHGAIWRVRP